MNKDKTLYMGVMLADTVLLCIIAVTCYLIFHFFSPATVASIEEPWESFTTMILCFIVAFYIYPSIIHERITKPEKVIKRSFTTAALFFLIVSIATVFQSPERTFPRQFTTVMMVMFMILLPIERLTIRKILMKARSGNRNMRNVIIVGYNKSIDAILRTLTAPVYGYRIVAIFADNEVADEQMKLLHKGKVVNVFKWLSERYDIHEIFVSLPEEEISKFNVLSKYCDNHLIKLTFVPDHNVFRGMHYTFDTIGNIPVATRIEEPLRNPFNRIIKRSFDIVASLTFIILIYWWVYIIIAIIIKIKSPGPIYFKQERTGIDGKTFQCIKFRSMDVNNECNTLQATKSDPRLYPFGELLRKTNIDEFPQFINVLKGEMSIVGPRPHMTRHTEEYSALVSQYMMRHVAKPGITGLAQVSGFRGETRYIEQMENRVKADLEYIQNWSFWLDIIIIFKTAVKMIKGDENAY